MSIPRPGTTKVPMLMAAGYVAQRTTSGSALDCCVFAQEIVRIRYALPPADGDLLALWRIHAAVDGIVPSARVWGPCEAAVRSQVANGSVMLNLAPFPGSWHVCQGWRSLRSNKTASPAAGDRGHTFLLYRNVGGRDTVIQSSQDGGPRIEWDTWENLRARYAAGLCLAALKKD